LKKNKESKKNLPENQKDMTMSETNKSNEKVQNEGVRAYGNQYKEEHHDKKKAD
jgi:hypothetical protein